MTAAVTGRQVYRAQQYTQQHAQHTIRCVLRYYAKLRSCGIEQFYFPPILRVVLNVSSFTIRFVHIQILGTQSAVCYTIQVIFRILKNLKINWPHLCFLGFALWKV